jgi:hypothetical protein
LTPQYYPGKNIGVMTTSGYTAFDGDRVLAQGSLSEVALRVKAATEGVEAHDVLVFDDATGRVVDLWLAGTPEEVAARYVRAEEPATASAPRPGPARRGPGRPKLGVVGKEVTLLPRHWEWLASQPGGASVTLRKLVERARKESAGADRMRRARETAYRFLSATAGDRPGFEEAARALFAGDRERYEVWTEEWPADVRDFARRLADGGFI